jgi:hypothetical protein
MKRPLPDHWFAQSISAARDGDFRGLLRELRSGNPSPEASAMAADLLEGKIKRPRHRPKLAKTWAEVALPAQRVRELERQGWGKGKRMAVVAKVAADLGISESAVYASLSECEPTLNGWDRLEAIIEYISRDPDVERYADMSVAEYISRKVLT